MEIHTEQVFKLVPEDVLSIKYPTNPVMPIIKSRQAGKKHHETRQYSKLNKRIHITGRSILK